MRLAVDEINHSTQLLPNHTLGYTIFDSCAYPLTGQRAALAVLNGLIDGRAPICNKTSPLLAVIGESGSAQSIVVSKILQPFKIPMVTIFCFKWKMKVGNTLPYLLFTSCYFICLYFEDQLLFVVCMSVWQKKIPDLLPCNSKWRLSGQICFASFFSNSTNNNIITIVFSVIKKKNKQRKKI